MRWCCGGPRGPRLRHAACRYGAGLRHAAACRFATSWASGPPWHQHACGRSPPAFRLSDGSCSPCSKAGALSAADAVEAVSPRCRYGLRDRVAIALASATMASLLSCAITRHLCTRHLALRSAHCDNAARFFMRASADAQAGWMSHPRQAPASLRRGSGRRSHHGGFSSARLLRRAADRETCTSATISAPSSTSWRCRRRTSASIAWSTCTRSP
jgi:hypothetical protein